MKARVSNSDGEDVPCAVWRREDLENFTVVDKVGVSKASAISEEIGTLSRDVLHAGTIQKVPERQDSMCNRLQHNVSRKQAYTHMRGADLHRSW